jgi:hypothetical protein
VPTFANAAPPLQGSLPALAWLAGLLEGEGSFLRPIPSDPARPIISCRMTDLDVVQRVSIAFGTAVQANDKGRHKTEFATALKGFRAVSLMRSLRPMMGKRRQTAIDRAIRDYKPPKKGLDRRAAENIRTRRKGRESISSLARCFGVSRPTIRAVLDGRVYLPERPLPWVELSTRLRNATELGTGLRCAELHWLAGWLEAEGSFCRPPPSSPRRVRIHAGCCDKDVMDEVGRLLGATVRLDGRNRPDRSPYWRVLVQGGRAADLMSALYPAMGSRRKQQIDDALQSALQAGAQIDRSPYGR